MVRRERRAPGVGADPPVDDQHAVRPQVRGLHVEEQPHAIRRPAHRLVRHFESTEEGFTLSPRIRQTVRWLKAGGTIWYAPDQDMRGKDTVFAPFFGTPASTSKAMALISLRTGAPERPGARRPSAGTRTARGTTP